MKVSSDVLHGSSDFDGLYSFHGFDCLMQFPPYFATDPGFDGFVHSSLLVLFPGFLVVVVMKVYMMLGVFSDFLIIC